MKSYIVLGLGRFGRSLALTLYELGHEVLGVDGDEKIVQDFSRYIPHTVQAEVTSEDFLKSVDIQKFDAAVVAVGSNVQVSIMTTVLLKELGARCIMAKAQDDFQEKVLYKIGADKVILPEKDMGIKAAHSLVTDHFFDMIEISNDYSIITLHPPESWWERSLGEIAVRARYGVNIIAVKSSRNEIVIPKADTVLHEQDILTVMGTNADLKRLAGKR